MHNLLVDLSSMLTLTSKRVENAEVVVAVAVAVAEEPGLSWMTLKRTKGSKKGQTQHK